MASNYHVKVTPLGHTVCISYTTPVAACVNGKFYKTNKKYSVTTTQHVNKFLNGVQAEAVDPEVIEAILSDVLPGTPPAKEEKKDEINPILHIIWAREYEFICAHNDHKDFQPPKYAPSEFWLLAMTYQRICMLPPHLWAHAEELLVEAANKFPKDWLFWLYDETSHYPSTEILDAWDNLCAIPVKNGCITEDYELFSAGDRLMQVYDWFENYYGENVDHLKKWYKR